MPDVYTVSFFGHRQVDNVIQIERRLENAVRTLLIGKEYVEFLVGRNGEFDQLAASAILRLKRILWSDNSSLVLVLPYLTAEYRINLESFESCYDEIEVSDAASQGHFKAAIQARNREMVDRSDLVICCIQHRHGGAWQTVRYAERQGKPVLDLAEADRTS